MASLRIVSYNVNGIRAAINKGLIEWLKTEMWRISSSPAWGIMTIGSRQRRRGISGEVRQNYKYQWLAEFFEYLEGLKKKIPLPDERAWMDKLMRSGWVDGFRLRRSIRMSSRATIAPYISSWTWGKYKSAAYGVRLCSIFYYRYCADPGIALQSFR